MSPANQHDSTKFIDVMESICKCVDDCTIKEIVSVYADKGYDVKFIREYLQKRKIHDCIPYRKNIKLEHDEADQNNYNKTRFVVERFFAWLKNGFHRTRIRYERNAENFLAFCTVASIMMYWRVLG